MARFNGAPSNANNMMKQLQKMQKQMEGQAKAFESKEFETAAGDGAVRVTMIDGREVNKVTLNKDAVGPDGVEMLEDLIKATINEALHMAEAENQQTMSKLTGGLPF